MPMHLVGYSWAWCAGCGHSSQGPWASARGAQVGPSALPPSLLGSFLNTFQAQALGDWSQVGPPGHTFLLAGLPTSPTALGSSCTCRHGAQPQCPGCVSG